MQDEYIEQLGPLPIGLPQGSLEQESRLALRNILSSDLFLVRDEPADDKGVDGTIEVVVRPHSSSQHPGAASRLLFTNCRAHFQLKGTERRRQNQDGSISIDIATSNLNYLLNGSSPIYFLWIVPDREMRYVWAREVKNRLDSENPAWREQQTVTMRFSDALTPMAQTVIHERIKQDAMMVRHIHESLARSTLRDRVTITIEPPTLRTTDPTEIYSRLTSSGMAIVASGYASQVMEWLKFLNPSSLKEARILLVGAYAQATMSRYLAAAGYIAEATLRQDDLSEDDRVFLAQLRDLCDFQTGRISLDQYLALEEARLQNLSGVLAAQHRLAILHRQRLQTRDLHRRERLLEELRSVAEEIGSSSESGPAQKLQADILVLSAEGEDLGVQYVLDFGRQQIQSTWGRGSAGPAAERQRAETWNAKLSAALSRANTLRHPLLAADVLTAHVRAAVIYLQTQRLSALWSNVSWKLPESVSRKLMDEAEKAIAIYSQAEQLEGECRAKLLLADLFDMLDQEADAAALAKGVLGPAIAMRYSQIEEHAREYVDGPTLFRKACAELKRSRTADEDVHMSTSTDAQIRDMASHWQGATGMPLSRLPFLEKELLSQRAVALERLNWCRHIQLIQDTRHTLAPQTYYFADPSRRCRCGMHGYTSFVELPDADSVISAFKATYCMTCNDRHPKEP